MKFYKEEKVYSLNEVTSTFNIKRSKLLEYEKLGLLLPYYVDKDTSYRYYQSDVFIKLHEIEIFLNAGVDISTIKSYFDKTITKPSLDEVITLLNKRKKDIDDTTLILSRLSSLPSINKFYKSSINEDKIYYYEERNIIKTDNFGSLFKEIYVHALNKDYMLTSSFPFIIFSLSNLIVDSSLIINKLNPKELIIDKEHYISKARFALEISRKYDEKNILALKKSSYLIYEVNNISFLKALSIFRLKLIDLIKDNKNLKLKDDIIYIYSSYTNVHKFMISIY